MSRQERYEPKPTDKKGRLRNKTLAFRMSEEEYAEVETRSKLCGYKWKQDYILDAILKPSVTARANPMMLVQFRKQLSRIIELLEQAELTDSEREEIFSSVRIMKEILEAF